MMLKEKICPPRVPLACGQSGKHRPKRAESGQEQKPRANDSKFAFFRRTNKSECFKQRRAKDERDWKVGEAAVQVNPENWVHIITRIEGRQAD